MALATRHNNNAFRFNNENKDVRPSKIVTRSNNGTRAALGAITNKVSNLTITQKNDAKIPVLQKSKGVGDLKNLAGLDKVNRGTIRLKKPSKVAEVECKTTAFSKQMLVDIDADDRKNPQLVTEYVNDIYDYMRSLETKYSVRPNHLNDKEINGRMRAILIDWMVQVHTRFNLLQETLYLAVSILDRFLQSNVVSKSKLQLIGVTAMLIASKYEEMYAPEVGDFSYITDNAYTKAEIRKTECVMLKALDFNLGKPLALHFLRRNSKAGDVDAMKHMLAKYFIELTIVDYEMVSYKPSEIAAAALYLSMKLYDMSWTDTLLLHSTYSESHLKPIVMRIASLSLKAKSGKLTAVYEKYLSSKFSKISSIPLTRASKVNDIVATCSS